MSYLPELRSSLVQAAGRQPEAPRRSRGWFGVAAAATVAIAVVAVAIVLVGHGRAGQTPLVSHGAPVPPTLPHFAAGEFAAIETAQRMTARKDPACVAQITNVPAATLARPAPALVHRAGNVTVYLVPSANVHALRLVPVRCDAEQAKALRLAMRAASKSRLKHALAVQAQFLAWQRYNARHPAGICLAQTTARGSGERPLPAAWQCGWSVSEINQGVAGLGYQASPSGRVFHGVVPDGVARVGVRFGLSGGGYRSLTVRVRNHWFVAKVPPRASFPPVTLTWWSAAGHRIKTIDLR
jgi:hypothetical protein